VESSDLKQQCHDLEINSAAELKDRLEKLTSELNDKWSKKFKSDYEKIRRELTQQKDEERSKAIDELQRQKDKLLTAAQNQIDQLEQQLIIFKVDFDAVRKVSGIVTQVDQSDTESHRILWGPTIRRNPVGFLVEESMSDPTVVFPMISDCRNQ
ncbi:unnamed protein product, partial [Rotaria magnacalcarata]